MCRMESMPPSRYTFSALHVAQSHHQRGWMGSAFLGLAWGVLEGVRFRPSPGLAALNARPPRPDRPPTPCQRNKAQTNNGAVVQTRSLASEVTL